MTKSRIFNIAKDDYFYIFRYIKYIIFLLILGTNYISAENRFPQGDNITIQMKNKTINEVMSMLEKNNGYTFYYSSNILDINKRVTISIKNESIDKVLDILLRGTNTTYTISSKKIFIKNKNTNTPLQKSSVQQKIKTSKRTIIGQILDAKDNFPLIGVSVIVKGNRSNGVISDKDGKYSIEVPNNADLEFSYIGYKPQTINIGDLGVINVKMESNDTKLDEVVVVGFGKQKKESLVGAVEAINVGDLVTTSSSFTTAFAGRIAGVISTQSSGQPGADNANFWIRGISTFGTNSTPLLILDGVEINSEMLNSIAPETIKSFSILKDATATALYGSKGANGVMIITTKSGKDNSKMNVDVRLQFGMTMPTKVQDIADGVTYMNSYNEAYNAQYGKNYFSDDKITGTKNHLDPYIYPDNDWYHLLFRNYSLNQIANINVTGGGRNINYFLNAAITHEGGMLKNQNKYIDFDNSISVRKYAFQSNITANITPTTTISVKLNDFLQYKRSPYTSTSTLFQYTMKTNPVDFPAMFPNEEGDDYVRYGNAPSWNGRSISINPLAIENSGYANTYLSYLTAVFEAEQNLNFITKGLKTRFFTSFYNKAWQVTYRWYIPHYYHLDSYSKDEDGNNIYNTSTIGPLGSNYLSTSVSNSGLREYSLQWSAEYSRNFGNAHDIDAMLVYHQKEQLNNTPAATEYSVLAYREQGLAGRLTYNYKDLYLFEANFGYNGSENFAKGHRWGFFPSVAIGWNVANEKFFSNYKKIFNVLKLRASWGKTGNDALDQRFPYLTTINTSQALNFYYVNNNTIVRANGATISVEGNKNATWEVSKKTNIGLDLGLFNDFTFIIDFYKDKRTGIFMQRRSVPSSSGFTGTTPYANMGAVTNKGIDFSMEYKKAFSKDLIVTARATFTYAHNEVKAKDEPKGIEGYRSVIGHPINTIFGLKSQKLFQDENDISNSPNQIFSGTVLPGDIKYKDLNNDNQIDSKDFKAVCYPTIPEIMYGFGPSIKYKRLDFSFYFQGTARVSLLMSGVNAFEDVEYTGFGLTQWIADNHWKADKPNTNAEFPRLTTTWNLNNMQTSDYWVRKASYLRLKSFEVGYTLKNRIRFYLMGTNTFTISSFNYWDPEMGSGNGLSYPLQRTFSCGIQYNF